jgi:hypothetical protein
LKKRTNLTAFRKTPRIRFLFFSVSPGSFLAQKINKDTDNNVKASNWRHYTQIDTIYGGEKKSEMKL